MEASFAGAAGFDPGLLQELIRGIIASCIVIWGVWVCWNSFKLVGNNEMDIGEWGALVVRTILVMVFVLILVAVN